MVEEAKRTLAYLCPACRQSVAVERSVFQLAASANELPCPCGKSSPPGGADGRPGEAHRPLPVLRQGSHRHLLLPRFSPREGAGLLLRRLGAGLLLRGGGGAGVCRPPAPGGSGGQAGGRFRGEGGLPGRAGDAGGALRAQGDRPAGRHLLHLRLPPLEAPGQFQLHRPVLCRLRRGHAHSGGHRQRHRRHLL